MSLAAATRFMSNAGERGTGRIANDLAALEGRGLTGAYLSIAAERAALPDAMGYSWPIAAASLSAVSSAPERSR